MKDVKIIEGWQEKNSITRKMALMDISLYRLLLLLIKVVTMTIWGTFAVTRHLIAKRYRPLDNLLALIHVIRNNWFTIHIWMDLFTIDYCWQKMDCDLHCSKSRNRDDFLLLITQTRFALFSWFGQNWFKEIPPPFDKIWEDTLRPTALTHTWLWDSQTWFWNYLYD